MANRKLLRQVMERPGEWEALEYDEADPALFQHRPVDTAQALRYQNEGGYQIAKDEQEFNTALKTASTARRAQRRRAMPTEAVLRRANPEGTLYETLEYEKADPRRAYRYQVKPEDVERWREEGGFDEVDDDAWARHLQKTQGVEEFQTANAVRPDSTGVVAQESLPSVARQPASDDSDMRAAEDADRIAHRDYIWARAGANLTQGLTGVGFDKEIYGEDRGSAVKRLLARREEERQKRLNDPTSEESRRFQRAVNSVMPGVYPQDVLEHLTVADENYITDYMKIVSTAQNRKAADEAAATRAKARQDFDAEQGSLNRGATVRAAAVGATARSSEAAADRSLKLQLAEMEQDGKKGLATAETEHKLRAEYNGLPEVKAWPDFSTSYDNLLSAAKNPNGIGGTTAIFSYMKLIDPGVAVMEGDVDRIRAAGGPAAAFSGLYERALTGAPVPQSVIQDMVKQAGALYQNRKRQIDSLGEQYGIIARQAGAEPSRVIINRGVNSPGAVRVSPPASLDEPTPTPTEKQILDGLRANPGDKSPAAEAARVMMRSKGFRL